MVSSDPRHQSGERAEAFVATHLQAIGWQLLGQRLRTPYAEVDLVGIPPDRSALVAVEVKARHPLDWAEAQELLSRRQHARLARAIEYLALRAAWAGSIRIDLCLVETLGGMPIDWRHFPELDAPRG